MNAAVSLEKSMERGAEEMIGQLMGFAINRSVDSSQE
jgi:hypothetical protein